MEEALSKPLEEGHSSKTVACVSPEGHSYYYTKRAETRMIDLENETEEVRIDTKEIRLEMLLGKLNVVEDSLVDQL